MCTDIKFLPYYFKGLLDEETHGGVASLYAVERAFAGEKVLNWDTC